MDTEKYDNQGILVLADVLCNDQTDALRNAISRSADVPHHDTGTVWHTKTQSMETVLRNPNVNLYPRKHRSGIAPCYTRSIVPRLCNLEDITNHRSHCLASGLFLLALGQTRRDYPMDSIGLDYLNGGCLEVLKEAQSQGERGQQTLVKQATTA